jgi:hypothetical protein
LVKVPNEKSRTGTNISKGNAVARSKGIIFVGGVDLTGTVASPKRKVSTFCGRNGQHRFLFN